MGVLPFVKYPEMIAACGSGKLIRKNSDVDILLLGSTMTSGYHKEYYSYSLFVELKDKLLLDDSLYKDQAAAYDRKFFELNGQKIAFDQKSKKYVLLAESADNPQSYDIKQEYDNRDKAILELTKNAVWNRSLSVFGQRRRIGFDDDKSVNQACGEQATE